MPMCGFNQKMVKGITTFSEGLYEATLERGRQKQMTDLAAVEAEIEEIHLFIEALRAKYGTKVESSRKMAEMIHAIALFARSLFESTVSRNGHGDGGLLQVFRTRVEEVGEFLEKLESTHQDLKRINTPEQTMAKAVEWIDANDK